MAKRLVKLGEGLKVQGSLLMAIVYTLVISAFAIVIIEIVYRSH